MHQLLDFFSFIYICVIYFIQLIHLKLLLAFKKYFAINEPKDFLNVAIKNIFNLTIIRIIVKLDSIPDSNEICVLFRKKIETECQILELKYEIEVNSKKFPVPSLTLQKLEKQLTIFEIKLLQIQSQLKAYTGCLESEEIFSEQVLKVSNPYNTTNKKVQIVNLCKNCTALLSNNV